MDPDGPPPPPPPQPQPPPQPPPPPEQQPGSGPDPRAALRAELSQRAAPSLRPASLVGVGPLRPIPGELLAKIEVRRRAGLDPTGVDHPRRERWQTVVLPELVLAPVAALVLIASLIVDAKALAVISAVVTAALTVLATAAWRWVQADPLRIRTQEHRALRDAGHWESTQPWTGALNDTPERALLGLAVEVVGRIAANPAWSSGYLDEHRLLLDLAAELDAVDQQAFTIAAARTGQGADAEARAALDAAIDRVQALRDYDASLAALTRRIVAADAELGAAPAIGALRGGVDQSGYAIGGVRRLTDQVHAITASVDRTAAEVRDDRS